MALNPGKQFRNYKFGFKGYGIVFEYNYTGKRFIETSISIVIAFEFPLPVPIDSEYTRAFYSYYLSLTDNIIKNRFTFGYGINYGSNHRNEIYRDFGSYETVLPENMYYSNRNLGLAFNTYYE